MVNKQYVRRYLVTTEAQHVFLCWAVLSSPFTRYLLRITDQLLLFILIFIITFIHSQRTISKQYPVRFFSVDLSSILSTVVKFKPRFSFMNCAGLVHEPHRFVVFLSPALNEFGQGVPVVHVFWFPYYSRRYFSLTEKQLKQQLALPNSGTCISLESRHW